MMMSEAERQYYLGRAGIHLWYARAPLPGAAPSPEFQFPVGDSDDAPEPESDLIPTRSSPPSMPRTGSGGAGAGKDRLAGIQALMANAEPEPDKTAEPVITRSVEPPAAAMAEPSPEQALPAPEAPIDLDPKARIEARLGFWVSEHLVLISSVSEDASERLQDTLAENILASLGESGVKESHQIRWPIFGNPRVPGNSDEEFRHILRSVCKEFGSRKLLLLGVLKGDMPSGRSEWLASTLGTPAIDFPRSLAELAAAPTYKRELWQQLKFALGV